MADSNYDAFERVKAARHPERPYSNDILNSVFTDFVEIHGDRRFADDPAMVCGFARIEGMEVCVIGQQKGRDTNQRRFRNFAMSKPEGYRKALRAMKLAEKFSRPIVTIVDTPGAYPGIDAEERGQAEAIAYNLQKMASLRVPLICVVLGEGGSGGALAIALADRVLMLENAVYSVITPEGCAAILWKDASKSDHAANSLKMTANDLKKFGLIDEIIPETLDWRVKVDDQSTEVILENKTTKRIRKAVSKNLRAVQKQSVDKLLKKRYEKFRNMGDWVED